MRTGATETEKEGNREKERGRENKYKYTTSNNEARHGQKKVAQSTHGKKKIFLFIETDASVPGMK